MLMWIAKMPGLFWLKVICELAWWLQAGSWLISNSREVQKAMLVLEHNHQCSVYYSDKWAQLLVLFFSCVLSQVK